MKEKLKQLVKPLADLKDQIDTQYKKPELKLSGKPATTELVPGVAGVNGYAIKDPAVSPSATESVQAAYNLWAILDCVFKQIQKKEYGSIVNGRSAIKHGLIDAINVLAPSGRDTVIDETTAQLAHGCSQFFAQAATQLKSLRSISSALFSELPLLLRGGVELLMPAEAREQLDVLTVPAMEMLSVFFDIAERGYRVKELSKEITATDPKDLSDPEKRDALRKKLLSVLPADQQKEEGLPKGLDEAFLTAYQGRCMDYLEKIKEININALWNIEKLRNTLGKFTDEREAFKTNFSNFFGVTVNTLITQVKEKSQPEAASSSTEPVEPTSPITVEPVSLKKISPEIATIPVETASPILEVAQEPTVLTEAATSQQERGATLATTTETVVSDKPGSVEDKDNNLSPMESLKKTLSDLTKKIEELNQELSGLSETVKDCGTRLETLNAKKVSFEKQRATCSEQLEKSLTAEQCQEDQNRLQAQRDELVRLRTAIEGNALVLDLEKDQDKLEWLGIKEQDLNAYLELQKQETDVLEMFSSKAKDAASSVVSWFNSLTSEDTKIEPTVKVVNYEDKKASFLVALDETDTNMITEQGKLVEQLKQRETGTKTLQELKTQLTALEEKITPLEKEIGEQESRKIELDEKQADLSTQQVKVESMIKEMEEKEAAAKIEAAKIIVQEPVKEDKVLPPISEENKVTDTQSKVGVAQVQSSAEQAYKAAYKTLGAAKQAYITTKFTDGDKFSNVMSVLTNWVSSWWEYRSAKNQLITALEQDKKGKSEINSLIEELKQEVKNEVTGVTDTNATNQVTEALRPVYRNNSSWPLPHKLSPGVTDSAPKLDGKPNTEVDASNAPLGGNRGRI